VFFRSQQPCFGSESPIFRETPRVRGDTCSIRSERDPRGTPAPTPGLLNANNAWCIGGAFADKKSPQMKKHHNKDFSIAY